MHRHRPLLLLLGMLTDCQKVPHWHREARVPDASFSTVWGSNGSTWSAVAVGPGGELELRRVWGATPGDVWAAGSGGVIEHFR